MKLLLLVVQVLSVLVTAAEGSSASTTPSRTELLMTWVRNIVSHTPLTHYPPTSNDDSLLSYQSLSLPSDPVRPVPRERGYSTYQQLQQQYQKQQLQQQYQNQQLQQQYQNQQLQQLCESQPQHNIQKQLKQPQQHHTPGKATQQPRKQNQHSLKLGLDHHHDYNYEVGPNSTLPQQSDRHSYPREKSIFYLDPKISRGKTLQFASPKGVLSQLPPAKPQEQSSYGSYTKETPKRRPWPLFTNAGKTPEELQREQRELREMMERLRDIHFSRLSEGYTG